MCSSALWSWKWRISPHPSPHHSTPAWQGGRGGGVVSVGSLDFYLLWIWSESRPEEANFVMVLVLVAPPSISTDHPIAVNSGVGLLRLRPLCSLYLPKIQHLPISVYLPKISIVFAQNTTPANSLFSLYLPKIFVVFAQNTTSANSIFSFHIVWQKRIVTCSNSEMCVIWVLCFYAALRSVGLVSRPSYFYSFCLDKRFYESALQLVITYQSLREFLSAKWMKFEDESSLLV